jgi:hypothetical protein
MHEQRLRQLIEDGEHSPRSNVQLFLGQISCGNGMFAKLIPCAFTLLLIPKPNE